jgi:hypothetical protein
MLLAGNPGLEVTPQTLLAFIAEKTKHSPRDSPKGSPYGGDVDLPERGRTSGRDVGDRNSRSSSRDSVGTSRGTSRPPSLGPPEPPKTPGSTSPFDASQRQRSTPLGAAPSSWTKRPAPAHRRKSINGSALSDSEVRSPSGYSKFNHTNAFPVFESKLIRPYIRPRTCPIKPNYPILLYLFYEFFVWFTPSWGISFPPPFAHPIPPHAAR